jgi:hypothetical protein
MFFLLLSEFGSYDQRVSDLTVSGSAGPADYPQPGEKRQPASDCPFGLTGHEAARKHIDPLEEPTDPHQDEQDCRD